MTVWLGVAQVWHPRTSQHPTPPRHSQSVGVQKVQAGSRVLHLEPEAGTADGHARRRMSQLSSQ